MSNIKSHFENNENFILSCHTEKQYESCLKWCHDNNYLSDSDYKDLTDIAAYDWIAYQDMLKQSFKNGGLCVHFDGKQFKGIDSYNTYQKVQECNPELSFNVYIFTDEIGEYGTIKSTITYYCSNCGAKQFSNKYNRCHWCNIKFKVNAYEETQ